MSNLDMTNSIIRGAARTRLFRGKTRSYATGRPSKAARYEMAPGMPTPKPDGVMVLVQKSLADIPKLQRLLLVAHCRVFDRNVAVKDTCVRQYVGSQHANDRFATGQAWIRCRSSAKLPWLAGSKICGLIASEIRPLEIPVYS